MREKNGKNSRSKTRREGINRRAFFFFCLFFFNAQQIREATSSRVAKEEEVCLFVCFWAV